LWTTGVAVRVLVGVKVMVGVIVLVGVFVGGVVPVAVIVGALVVVSGGAWDGMSDVMVGSGGNKTRIARIAIAARIVVRTMPPTP
jgi:hypothetical protein